jgi:5'-deoxynucleotidase YfbR-like HD superfamily hydrolase
MVGVASVASFITTNWMGENINNEKLILLCLLHDLGNIVRMDFDKQLGSDDDYLDTKIWKLKKQEMIEKYGSVDDEVTEKILQEIGIDRDISKTIFNKRFSNSIVIANSNDWMLKILLYSDLRVLPGGMGTLQQRLDEVLSRRVDLSSRNDIDLLCDACRKIEKDIQKYVTKPLDDINKLEIDNSLLNTIVVIQ